MPASYDNRFIEKEKIMLGHLDASMSNKTCTRDFLKFRFKFRD